MAQQVTLPGRGLDRVGLVFSKNGDPWPAVVQVLILDGEAWPRDVEEVARRTLSTTLLRVAGVVDKRVLWRPLELPLSLESGSRLLLLVERRDARRSNVELWLEGGQDSERSVVQSMRLGEGGAIVASAGSGPLALQLGSIPLRWLRHLAWLGLILGGLLLVCVLWLRARSSAQAPAPDSPARTNAWGDRCSLVLLLALTVAVGAASARVGIAWDEQGLAAYGGFLREYYARWFPDAAVVDHYALFNLPLYGGAFELVLALLDLVTPLPSYHARHLWTGLCGVVGVLVTWRLARRIAGPRVALWSALLLAVLPAWNGHLLNNTKDIPFAVGCAWALLVLVDVAQALPEVPPRKVLHLAAAMGLAMGVRVAGLMLPGLVVLAVAAWALVRWQQGVGARAIAHDVGRALLHSLLPALALAVVLMLLLWPWAQQAPLSNPLRALATFGSFGDYTDKVLVAGQAYSPTDVPRSYLARYLLVQLPELHLAALGLALLLGLHHLWRVRSRLDVSQVSWLMVAALALLPVLGACLLRPALYDGFRQVLFVLPPLCVLAAAAIDRAVALSWHRARALGLGLGLLCAVGFFDAVATTASLFPYQYASYNRLAGGIAGAQDRYELDYWGLCFRDAVDGLQRHLQQNQPDWARQRPVRVASCGHRSSADTFFPSTWQWTDEVEKADFVLTHHRLKCPWQELGRSVASVTRQGVLLCDVREVTR